MQKFAKERREKMKKPRKFMSLAIILCVIVTLVGFGGIISSALASSQSLVIQNAKGESITVGSVRVVNTGSSLEIDFNTDKEFPLFFTVVTFRGNTGGVTRVMSTGRTEFLTHKSDTHHGYSVPLSEIKEDDVELNASADVIVDGKVTHTFKAFVTARIKVPEVTTTTEKKVEVTTTTERAREVTTSTTVAAVTSTTAAVVTTETVAPVTTSTTVLPVTTTTILPVVTTVLPREVLPITGTDYNWYLIGAVLVLLGAAIYLGSAQRSN